MSTVQRLDYLTAGLPDEKAFALWKGVIGAVFEPQPFHVDQRYPTGSASGVVIGDIIVARFVFGAQGFRRERSLIDRTPDHFLFHLYNVGGFSGVVGGQRTMIRPSQVAVIDLRSEVEALAAPSDTILLVVPRALLPGLAGTAPRLDPPRNRLLAAHMASLREDSAVIGEAEVERTVSETVDFLRALFDPSRAPNLLDRPAADTGYLSLAEQAIRSNLASPDLSPDTIADEIGVSRATLYRIFAPYGGIMRSVQERRLLAARAALGDPLETRRLSRLATDFGFSSKVHFSRSFRTRFGVTASAFRAEQVAIAQGSARTSLEDLDRWWNRLGSRHRGA